MTSAIPVLRQPENLFLSICDVMTQNRDDLGLVTMKKFFVENGKGIKPMLGQFIQAKHATSEPVGPREYAVFQYLQG